MARVHVELGPIESLGAALDAERRFVAITGGTIRGDRLDATIDNGGAHWQTVHADGSITVDTRYSAATHDGAKLLIATRGIRRGDPAVMERLAAGDAVDPSEYSSATRSAAAVDYDLYAVT